ncbi:MAG: hypothetical protein Q4C09_08730 [Atopobiaceae bacterium]|nr:hypothetical protein [Atopobiaceae bacterium]
MKTAQELYSEIIASDELKKAFVEAMKADELGDFLKAHDCVSQGDRSFDSGHSTHARRHHLWLALYNSPPR